MTKPPTFHAFTRLNGFMTRFEQTPMPLRLAALLFLLVLAMLVEAAKVVLKRQR